jgi:esterase
MTLNYEVIGDKDNNNNSGSILFLHGLLGNGRNLNTFAKKVCEQQATKGYLMDLRGHGKSRITTSPKSSSSSFDGCVQDIRQTLLTTTLSEPQHHPSTLVGHSWGGRMALQYAATTATQDTSTTNNLRHVWLLDTVPGQANDSVERVISVVSDLLARGELFLDRKQLTAELQSRGLDPATSQWLASSYNSKNGDFGFDLDVVQDILPEFGAQDFFGLLESIVKYSTTGIRVDLVRGGRNTGWSDDVRVLNELQNFAKEYPTQFGLHVLPKAGHNVHVDDMNGLVDLFRKY